MIIIHDPLLALVLTLPNTKHMQAAEAKQFGRQHSVLLNKDSVSATISVVSTSYPNGIRGNNPYLNIQDRPNFPPSAPSNLGISFSSL